MNDELRDQGGDRGLVRITNNERGRGWQVTARVGDSADELLAAYEAARLIERKLREDDPPPSG